MTTSPPGATDPAADLDPVSRHRRAMEAGMAVAHWAATVPDNVAIASPDGELTFAGLNARVNRLVRALRARGLVAGDGIALVCTNRPEFVEVQLATLRAGWRLTPVNTHLTADEVAYIVANCEARALIVEADLSELANGAVASATPPDVRLLIGPAASASGDAIESARTFESYDDALAGEEEHDIDDPVPGSSMLYTSGTTGHPKGVHHPNQTPVVENLVGVRPGDMALVTGPLYHAAPYTLAMHAPLTLGAGIVLMPAWDPEEALALVERHRVTHTHLVPTMFHRLLALPEERRTGYDLSSLRLVLHGAAPCPVHVKHAMIEWLGPIIVEYYAATEGAGTLVMAHQWLERPGTVGKPMPEGQVKVGDADGTPLPPHEVGLVWLKSVPTDRVSYFGDDAKTESAYRGEYFTLGDMGYFDDDGWLFLTDRSAHLIISGGVNIYPAEVDAVLLQHPAVGDVATIGVPDDEWGESVLAVVEPAAGVEPSDALAAELIAFCKGHLASFKCPRAIDFVAHLPRGDNGKISKVALRNAYRETAAGPDPRDRMVP